jgi:hypothetical protein
VDEAGTHRIAGRLAAYPGPVRRVTDCPVRRHARHALAGLALAGLALAGCATSAPAVLVDTSAATPSPTASEQLLLDRPGADTAAGTLVDGFPTALVPVPDGAEILVSSAQPDDDGTLTISLNVRTEQDTAGLLDAVRGPLLAAGFTESPPAQPDASLAAQASFSRSDGAEYVLVGILDRDGQRTMTLGGRVRP